MLLLWQVGPPTKLEIMLGLTTALANQYFQKVTYVCEVHFSAESFRRGQQRKKILKGAVPT